MVCDRIKERMEEHCQQTGITMSQIARELGYTPKQLQNILDGNIVLDIEDYIHICEFFKVPASTFF